MKKYIKTIKELLALKSTDTPIFNEASDKYLKFIDGVLCSYDKEGGLCGFNIAVGFNTRPFIEVEESIQEATEKDIGKLCKFWNGKGIGSESDCYIGILKQFFPGQGRPYNMKNNAILIYDHCRRLTEEEIKEII